MDLESGTSVWTIQDKESSSYPPLKEDISCDVLIVGGGIMGALIAYELSKEKISVVVVEKGKIGKGSTIASTALLVYGLDVNLTDLVKMIGEEKAVRAYKLSRGSVIEIKRIIEELGLKDCYREKKVLYLASDIKDMGALRKEYETLRTHGFQVEFLEKAELKEKFSIEKEAAVIYHEAAEVDPYKLTLALLAAAHKRGVLIYESTEIARREKDDRNTCEKDILTTEGHKVKTCDLVFATGYESQNYLEQNLVDLKSSYVIASSVSYNLSSHWLKDYLVWETSRPYLYIRKTFDNRIIVGGEDEELVDPQARDALIQEKSRTLKSKFEGLVKNIPVDIEYAWAGTFGETKDGLGYVGIPKDYKNIYFALGFGGNGITFGVIAARIIKDLLLQQEAKNLDLFSFDRLPSKKDKKED